MADKTLIIEVRADGTLKAVREIDKTTAAIDENTRAQKKNQTTQKKGAKGAKDQTRQNKGVAEATNNSTHAFAKMAQQMNGIVPVYATVAANVFAITAAFGALERAADFKILIDSADSLAVQTGRSLTALAENMKDITGSAISMKEALVQASIAASAGFDNSTIEELTQVARNASVALGREMTDSLNRVFKGAIKAEPELLDELGIILRLETAANKYATALGKTAKELTTFEKQQAVVNEVLEQGQKKFGRLAEVDPNPFTQLAAAFSDITTELVNLVNLPISGFISFFTENTASLTAAIVLLAASVAKQALPALVAMGDSAVATFAGIATTATSAAKTVQVFATRVNKAARDASISTDLAAQFKKVGETAGKLGIEKIFDKSASSGDRLKSALASVTGQLGALKRAENTLGHTLPSIEKKRQSLRTQREELVKLNKAYTDGTIRVNTYAAATNILAKSVTFATNAISLGAGAMASFAFSLSHTAQVAFKAHGALKTIKEIGIDIVSTYKGASNKLFGTFGAIGSLAGGIGASLLKMVPIISIATIAFQTLGSAFTGLKKLFGFEDIAKLTEALDEQYEALLKSAAATENFKNNISGLPNTLENINDKLTLQSNILSGLAGNLKKVNEAISIDGGFGWFDQLLQLINVGDLETFKDSIPGLISQIDKLGFGTQVSFEIRELADSIFLGGEAAEVMGKKLQKTVEDLQRVSNGAKEANQAIIDGVENLNKSTSKLFGELPSLGGVDQTLSTLVELSSRLDGQEFERVADTISGFSSLTISTLGLENVADQLHTVEINTVSANNAIVNLKTRVDELREERGSFNILPTEEEDKLVKAIQAIKDNLRVQKDLLFDSLVNPLNKAVATFTEISNASRELKENLSALGLERLNVQNTGIDLVTILKAETSLRLEAIDIQTGAAIKAQEDIAKNNVDLETKRNALIAKRGKLDPGTLEFERAQSALGVLETKLKTNFENNKKFQLQLDKTRGKSATLVSKLFKETTKEINKIVELQAIGVEGLEDKYIILDNTLKESAKTLAELTGKTEQWADATLLAQKNVEEMATFLKRERIASTAELQKQIFNIESANIGMKNQLNVSRDLNNLLFTRADAQWQVADATAASNEALAASRVEQAASLLGTGDSPEVNDQLQRDFELQVQHLTALSTQRQIADEQHKLSLELSAEKTIQTMSLELKFLEQKSTLGSLFNRMDKESLDIAKLKAKLAGNDPEDIERIIALQQKLNKEQRKFDFAKSLQESAEAMNDLADGMGNLFANMQDDQFDNFVAGLQLMQDIGDDIDTPLGNMAKGFATAALASENYAEQIRGISDATFEARAAGNGELTTIQEQNFALQEQQAKYALVANAAGGLASAFEDGSKAAKVFTLVQQGAAIASAAAAIATQGEGDPYTAFARIAAMISLMSSVLGAAGIAFGGASSSGGDAEDVYKERLGDDSLLDRDLQGNYMVDALDALVEIDTQLFSATRDLQITMKNLGDTFEKIGAIVFASVFGQRVTDFDNIGSYTTQNEQGLINFADDFIGVFDSIGDPISGALGDLGTDLVGSLLGSTTTTSSVLDTGIDFSTLVTVTEEGLTGIFTGLNQLSQVLVTTESESLFGLSSSSSTALQEIIGTLSPDLVDALTNALDQTFDVVNGLINTFASAVGGIDIVKLFGNVSGEIFGDEFISLFELNAEEAGDAIGLYFSALSSDLLGSVLPFLQDYAIAGEELGETMLRLTANTIQLSNSLSTIGISLESMIGSIDTDSFVFDENTEFNNLIDSAASSIQSDIDALASALNFELRQGIWNADINVVEDLRAGIDDLNEQLVTVMLDSLTNNTSRYESDIQSASEQAAEAFKLEVVAAWEEELLSNFKDIDEFQEIFAMFSNAIFSETELTNQAITNATTNIEAGFAELISQVDGFASTDLEALLTQSGGDLGDALRLFFDDALSTGLFNADIIDGTEIDTAGADAFATVVKLGASINILDELLEGINDEITKLNEKYVQQIALFGKVSKEADLLSLAFSFDEAIKEAEEAGSDIALVEQAFALERLDIIKNSFEEIQDEISSVMDSIIDSVIEVSSTSDFWDDIAFSTIKINKLVDQLKKGTSGVNLDSLIGDTSGFDDFVNNFQNVIDSLSTEGPNSISDEIALVDDLREAIMDRYSLELELLQEQEEAYKDLSIEIQGYLDDLIISDVSPLTSFERLGEAESQFLADAANIFSPDEDIAAQAATDILGSADALLDAASGFYAIGPEYAAVFDLVTSTLEGIDAELLVRKDDTVLAIEQLNIDIIEQLGVLDSILVELEAQNQETLELDIAASITEGMFPLIGTITTKLDDINDGTWTEIISILNTIANQGTFATGADEVVTTPTADYNIDTLLGDITTVPSTDIVAGTADVLTLPTFDSGTTYVQEDMIAQIHQGETIVPESMAAGLRDGTLTMGVVQDNSEVVGAIKELTAVLAESQEDIAEATNRNVDASKEIANNVSNLRQVVSTRRIA